MEVDLYNTQMLTVGWRFSVKRRV